MMCDICGDTSDMLGITSDRKFKPKKMKILHYCGIGTIYVHPPPPLLLLLLINDQTMSY